ncbi:hypothetical protein PUN28_005695 [Cardiocondyla obscurior]|uniref:Uncharacterized protein n=1 Tax=Cardiocondyla obscurior TaxID=286306 RepID=A0AAW2G7E7_9HYME
MGELENGLEKIYQRDETLSKKSIYRLPHIFKPLADPLDFQKKKKKNNNYKKINGYISWKIITNTLNLLRYQE